MTYKPVLLRHGENEWNAKNLFIGWVDMPLSERDRAEATHGDGLLKPGGTLPSILHTSLLRHAIMTANLALGAVSRHWIPVCRTWRLNKHYYGALQGMNKKAIHDEYGGELFVQWRRSYDVPPPATKKGSEFSQDADPRYAGKSTPLSEYLKDALERTLPYWNDAIIPDLRTSKTVMIAAHGSSLHAIVKHLDSINDEEILGLSIPTGIPSHYKLGEDMKPMAPGRYPDPQAAENAIKAVANRGK